MPEKKIVKHYTKGSTIVRWEPGLCIHSAVCAKGLASVFNPKRKPWIDMAGADEQAIRDQVLQCPSGALSLEEKSQ